MYSIHLLNSLHGILRDLLRKRWHFPTQHMPKYNHWWGWWWWWPKIWALIVVAPKKSSCNDYGHQSVKSASSSHATKIVRIPKMKITLCLQRKTLPLPSTNTSAQIQKKEKNNTKIHKYKNAKIQKWKKKKNTQIQIPRKKLCM